MLLRAPYINTNTVYIALSGPLALSGQSETPGLAGAHVFSSPAPPLPPPLVSNTLCLDTPPAVHT